jgi:hypothetical protein
LPDGGGYPITIYEPTDAAGAMAGQNRMTFESDFGERTQFWHGVDVTFNARLRTGLTFSGGTSTGRTLTDRAISW